MIRTITRTISMPAGFERLVMRLPGMMNRAGRAMMRSMMWAMRRPMVTTAGATAGMVAVRMVARAMRAVNVARIMPVPAVPRGRSPGRHDAGGRQCPKREHGGSVAIVPIHRATIIIAVYGETGSIIAGIRPGRHMTMRIHSNTAASSHRHLTVRPHRYKA